MSERNPNERRPVRTTSGTAARPQGTTAVKRPTATVRPGTAHPAAARPGTTRPAGARPVSTVKRPVAKKKTKKKNNTGLLAIIALLVVAAVIVVVLLVKGGKDTPAPAQPTNTVNTVSAANNGGSSAFDNLLNSVSNQDQQTGMTGGNTVKVSDLSITEGLDESWVNILLLGVDTRTDGGPARADTMMICSINKKTGNVKLTSIMRDVAVSFEGHKQARLNTAYYYGGEKLAIKTINEYFGMNIQNYVYVDFVGFAKIAEVLGGTDMIITKNEVEHINANVVEQYWVLIKQGLMTREAAEAEYYATELKTSSQDANDYIHLNGIQTLGYARIRKLDSDYARAERQRKVLNKLMEGLKNASSYTLVSLYTQCQQYFRTNLTMNECLELAQIVLGRKDFKLADELRLPVQGSYKEEKRNDDAMLYDMDKEVNKRALYQFIYVQ